MFILFTQSSYFAPSPTPSRGGKRHLGVDIALNRTLKTLLGIETEWKGRLGVDIAVKGHREKEKPKEIGFVKQL